MLVTVVSAHVARNVVGIATIAISSGRNAISDAKTNTSTARAPIPPSMISRPTPGPLPCPVSLLSASKPVTRTGWPPTVAPLSPSRSSTIDLVSSPNVECGGVA